MGAFIRIISVDFQTFSAPKSLKTGIILPLFKGKGVKANYKDNYRGITLFPTLCKIYEMILLNRLEKFAVDKGYFSQLQFGFSDGVGCIEASFTILETINHMLELERGVKFSAAFWMYGKPSTRYGSMGCYTNYSLN